MNDATCPACGGTNWPSRQVEEKICLPFSDDVTYSATVHRCADCGEEVDRTPDSIVEAAVLQVERSLVRNIVNWLRTDSLVRNIVNWLRTDYTLCEVWSFVAMSFVAIERVLGLHFGTLDQWELWAHNGSGVEHPGPVALALLRYIRVHGLDDVLRAGKD